MSKDPSEMWSNVVSYFNSKENKNNETDEGKEEAAETVVEKSSTTKSSIKMGGSGWKPVAGIKTLKSQIDKRWPNRDKASDGIKGDSKHAARKSDHNPDSRGYVHAIDIDEDLRGSKMDSEWLARQIIAYPRNK